MALERLEIASRAPYFDGRSFGDAGQYERIDGVAHFGVDPDDPANERIVDLKLAERRADGRVTFRSDFCIIQPLDRSKGNGGLLLDVLNRGRRISSWTFNQAERDLLPNPEIRPGDGHLMRHGWTVAWCGWQWDVIPTPGLLGLEAPAALLDGKPIEGEVLIQFEPNAATTTQLLADRLHRPYSAADVDDPAATLTVRDYFGAPRQAIPRDRWRFAREENGEVRPSDAHVWMEEGFQPGRLYEVLYRTNVSPVAGTGLLATRDFVSFLKYGYGAEDNPGNGSLDRAIGFGSSQSGRFLRQFVYDGLNLDESGRQVFDGLFVQVAGARRGQYNHRYAQPSVQYTLGFGHLPPFRDNADPEGEPEESSGLLDRQRALGGLPKIMAVNSSAEYWRCDCALLHSDVCGERDVEPEPDSRVYLMASSQHMYGYVPLTSFNPIDGARGRNDFNALDWRPLNRAALTNLDRWIRSGAEPPPSVYPLIQDGSSVPPGDVIRRFGELPGAPLADPEKLRRIRRIDLGPRREEGVGQFPAIEGELFPALVSALDDDLNEIGGLRMPDVEVPLATYAGWNPRHALNGGDGQIIDMLGSTIPFAKSRGERLAAGDPRPSIEERYAGKEEYLAEIDRATRRLVERRYILEEDVALCRKLAETRWDYFTGVSERTD